MSLNVTKNYFGKNLEDNICMWTQSKCHEVFLDKILFNRPRLKIRQLDAEDLIVFSCLIY